MNKYFHKNQLQRVDLKDENSNILCELWPLNDSCLLTDEIVELLVKWRNRFMRYFKTQFKAEPLTTKQWLQNNILLNDRILFLIVVEDKPIGHYGLCNINEVAVELDNAIRGERGGTPDLFIRIEKYLIQFCFQKLKVECISAKVLSNNFLAISMHQNLGFEAVKKYPLRLVESDEKKEFVECEIELSNVPFEYIELKLLNIS